MSWQGVRRVRAGQRGDFGPQAGVGRQVRGALLGETAPDDQAVHVGGELLVTQRVEGHHLGSGGGQQLGGLGVAERERHAVRAGLAMRTLLISLTRLGP